MEFCDTFMVHKEWILLTDTGDPVFTFSTNSRLSFVVTGEMCQQPLQFTAFFENFGHPLTLYPLVEEMLLLKSKVVKKNYIQYKFINT